MFNILSLQKSRTQDTQPTNGARPRNELSAILRITRDNTELDTIPSTCKVTYSDINDPLHFTLTITPDHGFYKGGKFIFSVDIPSDYPYSAPKVKCTQKIYHPNIDLDGNVCLNILREDWNPVFTIVVVILGMAFLFSEPNPDNPLNKEAAEILSKNVNTFKTNVAKTMAGGTLNSIQFSNMKKSKEAPVIIETSVGKFLIRDFRPPIQLRTSPRKKKSKTKKEIKRLDENTLSLLTNKQRTKKKKRRINKIKKKSDFYDNDEQQNQNSILFIISNDDQENQLNEQDLSTNKYNLCFVNSTNRRALLFSPRSSRITLLGLFSFEQISGPPAYLHGFTLQPSTRYSVFNLSSQSLMSIETASSSSKISFNENQLLSFFNDYHIQLPLPDIYIEYIQKLAKIHHGMSVFFIEQLQTTWIESIKQFTNGILSEKWLFNNTDDDEQAQNTDGFKQLWPGMGAFKDSYHHSIIYSTEIRSTTDDIISRLSNKTTDDPLIVFVCGAKDSGKSTYLRYLINKCLSQTNILPKITFFDCDIGQSEFTPSGSISLLNNFTEPLFGPSASHLKKAFKSFYFGNIKVENDQIANYLKYVKLSYDFIRNQQYDLLLVNTMGWGSDSGLIIMKELIDLIKPNIVLQLRSSSPYFRHIMPDINPQWSINAPISNIYRQTNQIPLNYSFNEFDYNLLLTPMRQHKHHGKSSLTRQACLWAYFSQLETKQRIIKPFIDYINHIQILQFQRIGIGLLHKQIEPKYLLQVLNGSIVALCRVKHDMLYHPSSSLPALIDERANVECLGFGFVRSIDMIRREIHVIVPDSSLPKTMINALVKGHDDCPDEFYFMSIDRWRGSMPPYVTGIFNSTM